MSDMLRDVMNSGVEDHREDEQRERLRARYRDLCAQPAADPPLGKTGDEWSALRDDCLLFVLGMAPERAAS